MGKLDQKQGRLAPKVMSSQLLPGRCPPFPRGLDTCPPTPRHRRAWSEDKVSWVSPGLPQPLLGAQLPHSAQGSGGTTLPTMAWATGEGGTLQAGPQAPR